MAESEGTTSGWKMKQEASLIWLDLEMTGLNSNQDVILEIATIITDDQLTVIEQGPDLVIHQPEIALVKMGDWVKEQHTKSGLIKKVLESSVSIEQAEEQTLQFIKKHCKSNTGLLCGNSVWQDRNFLAKYMPRVIDYLYYRLIDVTAFKETIARWYPDNPHKEYIKKDTHRALDDIKESIEELRHYRTYFLK